MSTVQYRVMAKKKKNPAFSVGIRVPMCFKFKLLLNTHSGRTVRILYNLRMELMFYTYLKTLLNIYVEYY